MSGIEAGAVRGRAVSGNRAGSTLSHAEREYPRPYIFTNISLSLFLL